MAAELRDSCVLRTRPPWKPSVTCENSQQNNRSAAQRWKVWNLGGLETNSLFTFRYEVTTNKPLLNGKVNALSKSKWRTEHGRCLWKPCRLLLSRLFKQISSQNCNVTIFSPFCRLLDCDCSIDSPKIYSLGLFFLPNGLAWGVPPQKVAVLYSMEILNMCIKRKRFWIGHPARSCRGKQSAIIQKKRFP